MNDDVSQKIPSLVLKMEDNLQQKVKKQIQPLGKHSIVQYKDVNKKITLSRQIQIKNIDIFTLRFSQDDKYLAAGCADGTIKIIDSENGLQVSALQGSVHTHNAPTTSVRWKPKKESTDPHQLLSVNSDGSITHWDVLNGKPLSRIVENKGHNILSLDYNLDGSRFATAGKDFHVRIYDDETKHIINDFAEGDWNNPGHTNRVFSLKFLNDEPNILLSCGWDSNIHIWDLRVSKSVAHFYGPKVSGDSLDYKNNQILTGSYRNKEQIQLWDFKTRKLIKEIEWEAGIQQDKAYIYSIQFSKNNNETITGACSGLNEVRVFDENHKVCGCIKDMTDSIYTVDYANKSNLFAFAGTESVIYLINILPNP